MELPFDKEKFTEASICDRLNLHYNGNARYKLANAFVFIWECDFFLQKDNGYCYEFEVKITRSDFFNDKKKVDKHSILSTGKYQKVDRRSYNPNSTSIDDRWITTYKEAIENRRPNKFFYVVPENMVSVSEVPAYAGLIYVNGCGFTTIKEAPFIHKERIDFSSVLCKKFYYYWIDERCRAKSLEREVEYLKSLIK